MKQQGFSLIELMVALAVGSVFMVLVVQLFSGINRSSTKMMRRTDYVFTVPRALMLIDDDISAALVPRRGWPDLQQDDKGSVPQGQMQRPAMIDEEKERKIKQVFYAESRNDILTFFSCITSNTRTPYGKEHPPLVRVLYEMLPHPEEENIYQIRRRETEDIYASLQDLQEASGGFTLLSQVKSIKMRFFVPEKPAEEKAKEAEKKKPIYQEFTSWGTLELRERVADLVPAYVRIEGSALSEDYAYEQPFSLLIPIYRYPALVHKQEQLTKEAEAKKKREQQLSNQTGKASIQAGGVSL